MFYLKRHKDHHFNLKMATILGNVFADFQYYHFDVSAASAQWKKEECYLRNKSVTQPLERKVHSLLISFSSIQLFTPTDLKKDKEISFELSN